MYNDVKSNKLTIQYFINLLGRINLIDDYNKSQIEAELKHIVDFRDTSKYSTFCRISENRVGQDYLTFGDDIQSKITNKKRGWNEYNTEVSDLIDLFVNARNYADLFWKLLRKDTNAKFDKDNPLSLSTLFFLEFVSVIDYMLYTLVTNPKSYFEMISNESQLKSK